MLAGTSTGSPTTDCVTSHKYLWEVSPDFAEASKNEQKKMNKKMINFVFLYIYCCFIISSIVTIDTWDYMILEKTSSNYVFIQQEMLICQNFTELVFCFETCSDQVREKIVLVFKKNHRNSEAKGWEFEKILR